MSINMNELRNKAMSITSRHKASAQNNAPLDPVKQHKKVLSNIMRIQTQSEKGLGWTSDAHISLQEAADIISSLGTQTIGLSHTMPSQDLTKAINFLNTDVVNKASNFLNAAGGEKARESLKNAISQNAKQVKTYLSKFQLRNDVIGYSRR